MAYSFYLRGTKDEKKIYIQITHGSDIKVIRPTPFKVNINNWDKNDKRMIMTDAEKAKYKNHSPIRIQRENEIVAFNKKLSDFEEEFQNYFNRLEEDGMLTERNILDYFQENNSNGITTDFSGFVKYYCDMNIGIADSTKKVYNRTANLVSSFNKKVRMQDIDDRFKKDFGEYLDRNNYQRSYIRKTFGNIRDFWKYAKRKGLKVSDDPEWWELTKDFPDRKEAEANDPYFTWDELEQIKNIELENEYLDNARDWLLISCWTAQRVADLMEFKFDKIIIDKNKNKFLPIQQEKTGAKITIPLFTEVERILKKRNGQFPRPISHQKYNDYIKKVCEKAKINDMIFAPKYRQPVKVNGKTVYRKVVGYFPKYEVITSHIGRRTFISLFIQNVDFEAIRKITGHSRDKMVEVYNKLNSLERAEITKAKFNDAGIE